MTWYVIPTALLLIGAIGVYLNIRAYKKGQTISLKKLLTAGLLVLLGSGVFLQKMGVVDLPVLRDLVFAFDKEAKEKEEEKKWKELKEKTDNAVPKIK
ncbi:MAG: hypothetical protein MI810_00705 [Flavobacteriales bacterium]|nr:hypothetical protein [Flavobacteriales bacterium]